MPSDADSAPLAPAGGPSLHVVTGKGGAGKTTVAAALAMALASRTGGRVLLVEVEGRQALAPLFGAKNLPYEERRVGAGPDGGEVVALAIDAEEALLDYLAMFYKLGGTAGRALRKVGAIDFVTTIAPGMRDMLLTGKVKEAVTRSRGGRRVYDAVVLDAPPTGRVARFLNVTVESARLAKVGPIRNHSDSVAKLLHSPKTVVHLVTRLEEMPVQETADAITELTALKLPVGAIIVNAVSPDPLDGRRVTKTALRRDLAAVGLAHDAATVDALYRGALLHGERLDLEQRMRAELASLKRPVVELPSVPEGIDPAALKALAVRLEGWL